MSNDTVDLTRTIIETPAAVCRKMILRLRDEWSDEKLEALFDVVWAKLELEWADKEKYGHLENREMTSVKYEESDELKELYEFYIEKENAFERANPRRPTRDFIMNDMNNIARTEIFQAYDSKHGTNYFRDFYEALSAHEQEVLSTYLLCIDGAVRYLNKQEQK